MMSKRYGKHRQTGTAEYRAWNAMKTRCENPNYHATNRYRGRGISICERWRNSFEMFLADMGPRPAASYSVDRIDNDKGYEPGNCRWATKREQARNRGRSQTL
jgi:hypothetical protein